MPEPYLFERVTLEAALPGCLYRVARPGRSYGTNVAVTDAWVREWAGVVADELENDGVLPQSGLVRYVCLLGWKPDGRREITDFYSARQPDESSDPSALVKPLWQDYLTSMANGQLMLQVNHVQTMDHREIAERKLEEACDHILAGLKHGETVLVGCSAGCTRTGKVLAHLRERLLLEAVP